MQTHTCTETDRQTKTDTKKERGLSKVIFNANLGYLDPASPPPTHTHFTLSCSSILPP